MHAAVLDPVPPLPNIQRAGTESGPGRTVRTRPVQWGPHQLPDLLKSGHLPSHPDPGPVQRPDVSEVKQVKTRDTTYLKSEPTFGFTLKDLFICFGILKGGIKLQCSYALNDLFQLMNQKAFPEMFVADRCLVTEHLFKLNMHETRLQCF